MGTGAQENSRDYSPSYNIEIPPPLPPLSVCSPSRVAMGVRIDVYPRLWPQAVGIIYSRGKSWGWECIPEKKGSSTANLQCKTRIDLLWGSLYPCNHMVPSKAVFSAQQNKISGNKLADLDAVKHRNCVQQRLPFSCSG